MIYLSALSGFQGLDNVYVVIEFLVIAAAVLAYAKWDISLSRAVLKLWATREGLEILEISHRNFFRGPFSSNSRYYAVFFIKARNAEGLVRNGWVRLKNNGFLGVKVEWEN